MSNERGGDALPVWVRSALRRPVPVRVDDVERIMARVRLVGAPPPVRRPRRRRASRLMVLGVTMAASVAGAVIGVGSARALWRASLPAPLEASATLIGDSIVSTLHDTLDLVRFALRVRGASRVVLAGDFNGWSASATPLARDRGAERWTAVVALRHDDSRYAFLVDDTRWVSAPRVARRGGGARTVLPPRTHRSDRDST